MSRKCLDFRSFFGSVGTGCLCALLVACPPESPTGGEDAGKSDPVGTNDGGGDPIGSDGGPSDGGPTDDGGGTDPIAALIAAIDDGDLDTVFVLDGQMSRNEEGRVLTPSWEVLTPAAAGCEGTLSNAGSLVATFAPSCRGDHRAILTLRTTEGEAFVAEEAFAVVNRPPELNQLRQEGSFSPGGDVVVSAFVTDDDDDETTCTIRLADDNAGDPTGLVVPSDESADCRFTLQTPTRIDTWKLEVVASDGFDDSMPATVEITPGNAPPVIQDVTLNPASVGYSCADGACATAPVRVTVTASDDVDPFESLAIEIVDGTANAPAGAYFEVSAVAGQHGVFDLVVKRDDYGTLAGTFTMTAVVTESSGGSVLGSATLQRTLEVVDEAPSVDDIVLGASTTGYTCSGATCQSDPIRVTIAASDNAIPYESLVLTLEDTTSNRPEGVSLEITEVAGQHGAFDVVVKRESLGPMAATYRVRASVAEPGAAPASATLEAEFDVVGQAPVLGQVTAPNAPHTYDDAAQRFEARLEVTLEASDPEQNRVGGSVVIASCPRGDIITTNCNGPEVTVVEEATASGVTFSLSAASLVNLAGTYTLNVAAVDADGTTSQTRQVTVSVLNQQPSVLVQGTAQAFQRFVNGAHEASFSLFADPEGDPLSFTLSVTCPDGSSAQTGQSCNNQQALSVSADGVVTLRGPASAFFLGNYTLSGTVSDPRASRGVSVTLEIQNNRPSYTLTSSALQECDHKTLGSIVTNDTAVCRFQVQGTAADADGDPLTLVSSSTSDARYVVTNLTSSGSLNGEFDVLIALSDFRSDFANQTLSVGFQAADPFDARSDEVAVSPRFLNRAPTSPTTSFQSTTGSTTLPPLTYNYNYLKPSDPANWKVGQMGCADGSCPVPAPYELYALVPSTDADGDPLEVSLSFSCNDNHPVLGADDVSVSTFQPLAADGLHLLKLPGTTVGSCSATGPDYREWRLEPVTPCSGFGCVGVAAELKCTLTSATVRDGIGSTTSSTTRVFRLSTSSTGLVSSTCP